MRAVNFSTSVLLASVLFSTGAAANCSDRSPASDFIISDNGVATHKSTGLMWQRCLYGTELVDNQCTDPNYSEDQYYFEDALKIANESTFAGFDDWRLPNFKELISLYDFTCTTASLNTDVFPFAKEFERVWHTNMYVSEGDNTSFVPDFDVDGPGYGAAVDTRIKPYGREYVFFMVRDVE